jgi:hypothetical protein
VSQFSAEGEIGKEILEERITRDAIVREVEALLVMDIEVATRMRDWIDDKIKKIQELIKTKKTSKAIPEGKE